MPLCVLTAGQGGQEKTSRAQYPRARRRSKPAKSQQSEHFFLEPGTAAGCCMRGERARGRDRHRHPTTCPERPDRRPKYSISARRKSAESASAGLKIFGFRISERGPRPSRRPSPSRMTIANGVLPAGGDRGGRRGRVRRGARRGERQRRGGRGARQDAFARRGGGGGTGAAGTRRGAPPERERSGV
jgi:hypothetical protein